MEQVLEQRAKQVQSMRIWLGLYLERENALRRLYQEAAARGDVLQYDRHGLHFYYARVRREEVPEPARSLGCAFAHCLYDSFEALLFGEPAAMARGEWLLFVITDYFGAIPFPEQ
jgi:hypothetical protein